MEVLLIVAAVVLWLASGASSFIYWWTKEFPFTTEQLPLVVFVSILGPLAFGAGWAIHGDHSSRTLIKQRNV